MMLSVILLQSSGDSADPKVAEALNQVALPVVPHETCKSMTYWWFQVKTSMICGGYTLPDDLKSVCQVLKTDTLAES